ncbi:hypothetical protein ACLB2K_063085 [Fragaria x ananassa]
MRRGCEHSGCASAVEVRLLDRRRWIDVLAHWRIKMRSVSPYLTWNLDTDFDLDGCWVSGGKDRRALVFRDCS